MGDNEFSVSRKTNVIMLADSIYHTVVDGSTPVITAVGPDALSQMTKALARARSKLLYKGYDIKWYSFFEDGVGATDQKPITLIKTRLVVGRNDRAT